MKTNVPRVSAGCNTKGGFTNIVFHFHEEAGGFIAVNDVELTEHGVNFSH